MVWVSVCASGEVVCVVVVVVVVVGVVHGVPLVCGEVVLVAVMVSAVAFPKVSGIQETEAAACSRRRSGCILSCRCGRSPWKCKQTLYVIKNI